MGSQKDGNKDENRASWFWKWFMNNKVVSILLVSLLILLNLFILSKVTFLFNPVKQFFGVIGLPVLLAGVLFYLLNPLIDWMEKRKVPRLAGIGIVFVIIIGMVVWGIIILIPIIRDETMRLIENWPTYWGNVINQFDNLLRSNIFSQLQVQLADMNQDIMKSLSEQTNTVVNSTFSRIGNVFGTVTNIVIALVTMPIILFFLLKDGQGLAHYIMKFFPTKMRSSTFSLLKEINTKISQYIRGQLVIAFFVGLMFWIGFKIIGLEYAALLAISAGVLNLVPYLGSFIAMIPIVIVALVTSPFMFVKVMIVFAIEQAFEGRLIQPLILGSNLKMHPLTIIIVLLAAGKIFGVLGVIIGIPTYAVLKVIFEHIFNWYKMYSGLYEQDFNPAPAPKVKSQKTKIKVRRKK